MQRTEKKDNYAKDFEKYIGQEERRLLELLENGVRKRESESEKFRSQITSLLASALAPTATKATTAAGKALNSKADAQKLSLEDVSPEKHPLYLRSQALLQCTKSLVQEYDKLSAYIANLEPPPDPAETWQRDCAETRRVIAVGVEASQAEVERLLVRKADQRKKDAKEKSTSKGAKDGKGSKEAFEKDEHLQAMLKMGRGGDGDGNGDGKKKEPYGWGRVAHRVVKGMKSLVKGLPAE
ncbi:hypothetical protein AJ79_00128 [Helicocarpus griseus UAMH5409]|uniref:Uncharacterized protein n=1 Tax=Helicocarpus griseus UAMH5409 TaxID=1447875 RepID=A0A2B7Y4M7_9EURO|nr:hypothetical protein AJ79_00128 [Helicocarpus griseus UAMH5409]